MELSSQLEAVSTRFRKSIRRHVRGEYELIVTPYNGLGVRFVVHRPAPRRGSPPTTLATVQARTIGKPWETAQGLVGDAVKQIRKNGAGIAPAKGIAT